MNMKPLRHLAALLLLLPAAAMAQSLSADTKAVMEACQQMANSVGSGSLPALRTASRAYRQCRTRYFAALKPVGTEAELNGHFVFDHEFADSLVAGRKVYQFARRYASIPSTRAIGTGRIFTRTCAVAARQTARYTFIAKNSQELAVVAEPGGKVTLRVHDKTHNKWYNDTVDVKKGRQSRTLVFDLPSNSSSQLELQVINCSRKPISFVVISN